MKKVISSLLVMLFVISCFAVFNTFSFKAKANETNIYSETNTYEVDTTSIEKNVQKVGYSNGQYKIAYDMNNKKTDCLVAENPTVTVFTHGYDSWARDWLNNAEDANSRDKFVLKYNNKSMVDKVISLYGGINKVVLLLAKMESFESFSISSFTLKIGNDEKIYQEGNLHTFSFNQEVYGKHIVILFENSDDHERDSNNNIYFQFNYMLSKVLYDLKQLDPSRRIPKVNLIGHSRGGITNMQYALDHPDIVANLISIGTPYDGSTSSVLMKDTNGYKGDGLNDIINQDKYNDYKDRWNQNYETLYKDINVLAIGAYSTLPFLGAVAHNDKSGKFDFWKALAVDAAVSVVSVYKMATAFSSFFRNIATRVVSQIINEFTVEDITKEAVRKILDEIQMDGYVYWYSDAVIPLSSQVGKLYKGFKRTTKCFTLLSLFDENLFKRFAQWQPPVVHNLEPWDEYIIKKVVEELTPSVVDNTANYKYKNNSDGTVSVSGLKAAAETSILDIPATINGKTVRGISSGAFAGEPSVISKLNANNASVASYAANNDNNLAGVTTINIPSTVTEISSEAFSGMESLTTVNFGNGSQLQTIGASAFADCVNLTSINLPSGITEIPFGAFENCKNLASLTIPSGVTKIGAQAFSGAEKLAFTSLPASVTEIGEFAFFGCKGSSTITLPSGVTSIGDGAFAGIEDVTAFSISSANANYTTENGVLYNKAKTELQQYPKAKTDTTFMVNSNATVTPSNVYTIKSYAFYGCENLTQVNINYVSKVESSAFANCTSLATIYALGLTNAELDAFSNTPWIENQLSNNGGKVVLGELLVLYAPENKTVMDLSDWTIGISSIAEQAFALSNLETIYIPSRVSRWNENAFVNAQKLKDVYVEKMNSDLLARIRTAENLFGNNHADLKLHVAVSSYMDLALGQTAISGIPTEIISTNVTYVKNGVETTRTLYYDEQYVLEEDGTVIWGTASGERFPNTGVWKSFAEELTIQPLQVNNCWLTRGSENLSPVSLIEGDRVSLTYTANGIITVTINDEILPEINLGLPAGTIISGIKSSDGQAVNLNNTVYTGQFTSFNVETTVIEYFVDYKYCYYTTSESQFSNCTTITLEEITAEDLSEINRTFPKVGEIEEYRGNNYLIVGVYSDVACTNAITELTLGEFQIIEVYIKCYKISIVITLDYGDSVETRNILFTELNNSGTYTYTLPSCSREGYTVTWKEIDGTGTYTPGADITVSESKSLKLNLICVGTHTTVKTSIDDEKHETKCTNCDYRVESDHILMTTQFGGDLFVHKEKCKQCNYSKSEAHSWTRDGDKFVCLTCGKISKFIPSVPGLDSTTYLIIDRQGNILEVSYEEAVILARKYELEEQEDVAA